ncbi:hypothetical protein C8F04DRAFT_1325500 [Mycena alexandri]|uniref:Uncharacterized protein n=1 Tax=Mycena alexandri TaxID=1745969 RepID=A0AAD6S4F4_9AGAR|nr:hypothetical protein C8F04DRAFT_1325500 [Mycena alexandri]
MRGRDVSKPQYLVVADLCPGGCRGCVGVPSGSFDVTHLMHQEFLFFHLSNHHDDAGHRLDPLHARSQRCLSTPPRPLLGLTRRCLLRNRPLTSLYARRRPHPPFDTPTSSPHPPNAPPPPPLRARRHAPTSRRVARPRHSFVSGSLRSHKRPTLTPSAPRAHHTFFPCITRPCDYNEFCEDFNIVLAICLPSPLPLPRAAATVEHGSVCTTSRLRRSPA